ncbi:Zinc finger CHCC-type [Penicillium longicatenatum]|uniref:Zinc finger CHCC-type n=1 Tax=Penicillium longicatenatum TaxID=1561947 RepID=UPI0025491025|nr:Zinc finger CHCC-type [Penicillium longicatenatum]KAJ5649218.1 Zinc finger CHCC-type [Penicillium longicatenatum]KAJ5673289.1 Zinc finger CHCC-type [Penicillium longicatenatum]
MMSCSRRLTSLASSVPRFAARTYSSTVPRLHENRMQPNDPSPPAPKPNVSATNAPEGNPVPIADLIEMRAYDFRENPAVGEQIRSVQAPNRATTWAASQQPREKAMTGPRFEQTIMETQPRPLAAIELIHKQPVRWTKSKVVSCDGGGGPLGHPKVFINTDKPEIATCGYCGLPFAQEKHKAYLKSLPATSYPLEPTGDVAEVNETQRVAPATGGLEQR